MHENLKLAETEYFLNNMTEHENDPSEFHFLLSAFLSAARSVLQYALEEVKGNPQAQQWYEAKIAGSNILKFFKGKRDINIHQEPVQTNQHITIALKETVHISEAVRVVITRGDGTTETHNSTGAASPPKQEESKSLRSSKYFFNDWSGTEDVVTLCHAYAAELRNLVTEGVANNYISG